MKVGLHFSLACAEHQSALARYRATIEQATRAEELGFESVWPVEQHFQAQLSALPAPLLLLAAIAERTRRLRLGTAILQLPLSHPMRIAEEVATLDVLSAGRVELGLGRGANPSHFSGYGLRIEDNRERLSEGLALLRQAFTSERFSFHGRHYRSEDAQLAPRPIQLPGPPLHIAANSLDTAALAGREGVAMIAALHVNPLPALRELTQSYERARAEAGHERASARELSLVLPLFVGHSRTEIERELSPSIRHMQNLLGSLADKVLAACTSEPERTRLEQLITRMRSISFESFNDGMGIFDTPEACLARLEQLREQVRFGRLIAWFNPGGLVSHEAVMRSMALFSERVMAKL